MSNDDAVIAVPDPVVGKLLDRVGAMADSVEELIGVVKIFASFYNPDRPDSDILTASVGWSKDFTKIVPITLTNGDLKKASDAIDFVAERLTATKLK